MPVEFQWNASGMPVEFQWNSSGIPVNFQWNSSGMPVEFHSSFRFWTGIKTGTLVNEGQNAQAQDRGSKMEEVNVPAKLVTKKILLEPPTSSTQIWVLCRTFNWNLHAALKCAGWWHFPGPAQHCVCALLVGSVQRAVTHGFAFQLAASTDPSKK